MSVSLTKKLPALSILFFLIFQTASTIAGDIPRHFEPGFILKQNGDTLRGYVWNPRGAVFHLECRFISAPGEQVQRYTPLEIKGFGFETNRLAISRTIDIATLLRQYDTDLSDMEPNARKQAIRDFFNKAAGNHNIDTERFILEKEGQLVLNQPLFLEVAIIGELSLYLYNNQMFVQKQGDDQVYLLFQSVTEMERDSRTYRKRNNEHIGILKLLTHDCPNIGDGLENIKLSFSHVSRIVEKYNICSKQPQRILGEDPTNIKITFGFSLHSGNQMVSFENDPQFFPDAKYNSSERFTVAPGVFANMVFHKTRLNIGASLGFIYNQYNPSNISYVRKVHPDGVYTVEEHYHINMSYLKMPVTLTIRPSNIPLRPTFLFGLTYNQNFRADTKLDEETTFHETGAVHTTTDSGYFQYNLANLGFITGIDFYLPISSSVQLVTGLRYDRFANPVLLNTRVGGYTYPPATTGSSAFSMLSLNLAIQFSAF